MFMLMRMRVRFYQKEKIYFFKQLFLLGDNMVMVCSVYFYVDIRVQEIDIVVEYDYFYKWEIIYIRMYVSFVINVLFLFNYIIEQFIFLFFFF